MRQWYCIRSSVGAEYKAERDLSNFYPERLYLPEIQRDKRIRKKGKRQTKRITEPMFPAYLFIYLDEEQDDWSNIRKCGVQLVRRGQFIPAIDEGFINDFKNYDQAFKTDYEKGDNVVVNAPGFVNVPAIVKMAGRERVEVLMSFLGTERIITVSRYQIEPEPI